MSFVAHQPIQLAFFVADIAGALVTYDRVRWWRSRTGQFGLYTAATAPTAQPAVLTGSQVTPFQLNGKTLSFIVNGVTQVDVPFTDPDPVTITQVLAAVVGATALVTPSNVGGALVLTTVATGSLASLEIVESDGAAFLGFSSTDSAVGQDADTILVSGTHEYTYTDQNSDPAFWYRTELVNHTTLQSSGLGPPFQAGHVGVPDAQKLTCFIRLVDLVGRPLQGRVVTFANLFLPNTVLVGSTRWGLFRQFAQIKTDADGYAEIRLPRGAQIDFAVDGTDFVRRFAVPTTGDSQDLLDPALSVQDEFGIQQPQIDFAVRTT